MTASETAEGKRRKKRFSITETGRASFSRWVAQPMQADRVKNMELSRLFFAGLAQPEERLAAEFEIGWYSRLLHELEEQP